MGVAAHPSVCGQICRIKSWGRLFKRMLIEWSSDRAHTAIMSLVFVPGTPGEKTDTGESLHHQVLEGGWSRRENDRIVDLPPVCIIGKKREGSGLI